MKLKKHAKIWISTLILIIIAQAVVIALLFLEKDDKVYEVNLVKINSEKDSINYGKMKSDLSLIDQTLQQLNHFLLVRGISNPKINTLAQDSLSNCVYLAEKSNRYSEILVSLEEKMQQVPLGMPVDGYISSLYGNRINPLPPALKEKKKTTVAEPSDSTSQKNSSAMVSKKEEEAELMQFHKGMDIATPYGSDVVAAADGKVIYSGAKGGYGNCIIVLHSSGLATLYGHLSQLLVKVNDPVTSGQIIAKSGNSGRSTGPHLHYEVHRNQTPVNPKLFVTF